MTKINWAWVRCLAEKMMQKLMLVILALLVIVCLSSCTTPGVYILPSEMTKPMRGDCANGLIYPEFMRINPDMILKPRACFTYRVGPQDILTIIVWNHPELTIPSMQTTAENVNIYTHVSEANTAPAGILVNERGYIFFPLAGKLHVAGLTVDQIRTRLTHRLIKYIRHPQVSIRVSSFRSKPVYVIGEVVKQGIQPITDVPMTIMDAINQSGGIDRETSDAHYIYVIRGHYLRPQVYWLEANTPGAILMAENFLLESRDIVLVSTAGVTRWNRTVNKILPTIQTFLNPPVNMRTDN